MPPADFSGLSEEELRNLEGNERRNLEARIQCLRNIHTLLDASMVLIAQYTSVAGALKWVLFFEGENHWMNENTAWGTPKSKCTCHLLTVYIHLWKL